MNEETKVYLALLHYPMRNKRGDIIATSVTNLDIHDISRVARTYGIKGFFIIHPIPEQQELIRKIMGYWQEGYGGTYNPDRKHALDIVHLATDLEDMKEQIYEQERTESCLVATDASLYPHTVGYEVIKQRIRQGGQAIVLLFGTGWGMPADLVRACDYILPPLAWQSDYNHLSVRSAVAITVDRLLGENWYDPV